MFPFFLISFLILLLAQMLRDEKAQLEDLKVKVNAYRSLPAVSLFLFLFVCVWGGESEGVGVYVCLFHSLSTFLMTESCHSFSKMLLKITTEYISCMTSFSFHH